MHRILITDVIGPEGSGDYSVVIMNSDGSKNVDVSVQLGAKVPILRGIGTGLLWGNHNWIYWSINSIQFPTA